MKNSQHLKAYVQMHPDNKMAWYLLGKEYHKNGQEGKANYCFNEAGEIYEAFEHSKVPSAVLREYEEGLMRADLQRHQGKLKVRRLLIGLMLTLLLFIPSNISPGAITDQDGMTAESNPANIRAVDPQESVSTEETAVQFTAQEDQGPSSEKQLLNLLQNKKAPLHIAVLGLKRSGRWLLWSDKPSIEYTVTKKVNGQADYQSYDPASCSCQPPEHGKLVAKADQWQEQQVELAVLSSSIKSFYNSKGRPPASLKELSGAFPGNWLAGATPSMKQSFAELTKNISSKITPETPSPSGGKASTGKNEEGSLPVGATESNPSGNKNKSEVPFLSEPLSILVDKEKHRLAVISGNIIIRNYEVGLGGNKTPEGSFVISDKVINPNGHSNGEFGSRGMQLSDSNYAIHGTNEPESIGKDESLGCIRMKREDVEELFALVPKGTKVQISKGVLPAAPLLPKERFSPSTARNQTNPHKVYHWLN